MSLSGKRLGLLLASPPGQAGFQHGVRLAEASLKEGADVYLYCIHDAVAGVADPRLQGLKALGLKLYACAYGAQKRQVPMDDKAIFAGLGIVSDLMARTGSVPLFHMNSTLFIITGDPKHDGRVAEAVRIAAGVAVWKKNTLALYFRDMAVMALSPDASDFVDGDVFTQFFPLILQSGYPIFIQKDNACQRFLNESILPYQAIPDSQLPDLIARYRSVLRFLAMNKVLHILTRKDDDMVRSCVPQGGGQAHVGQTPATHPAQEAIVFDLTQPAPDYVALAYAIFEADTVAVW